MTLAHVIKRPPVHEQPVYAEDLRILLGRVGRDFTSHRMLIEDIAALNRKEDFRAMCVEAERKAGA